MMARSTTRSNQRPDTLMQDRTSANSEKVLLQRTAGPYIGSFATKAIEALRPWTSASLRKRTRRHALRYSALRFESLKIGAEIPREIPLYNCNHYCANEHAKKGNPSCPFDLNRGFDDLLYRKIDFARPCGIHVTLPVDQEHRQAEGA